MIYEWDAIKSVANLRKHGIAFIDAATVFLDTLAVTFPDPDHSGDEHREITIGHTMRQYLVLVSHCERGDRIRIISARLATRRERRQYEEGIGKDIR
ncbi:MAG: BrnT family toxin [Acidobacteriota bacterium]|nr:BrnT family toxin [Acidobacteriota bacterium]